MKKIIVIVSSLLLISPLYSMYNIDIDPINHTITIADQELLALYESTDPNRYGPLNLPTQITDQDHQDAVCLVEKIKQNEFEFTTGYSTRHHLVRHDIARAVVCKKYHNIFAAIATDTSDLPLWEHLNKYREQIKQTHNIDVVSARIGLCDNIPLPPLLATSSLEIAKFLIETAQVSIPLTIDMYQQNIIHRACHANRSPALLAYCLEKYPAGANSAASGGYTPLHVLCQSGLGATIPSPKQLPDVLEKLAILKKAGANFLQEANTSISALPIVEWEIKSKQYNTTFWETEIKALSILATHINAAVKEQQTLLNAAIEEQQKQRALVRAAKIAEATGQDCSICLEPMNTNLHALDCLHVFHEDCVLQTTHAGQKTCPLCRANTLPQDTTQKDDDDTANDDDDSDDSDSDDDDDGDDDDDDADQETRRI